MIDGIDHIVLTVRSLDESCGFYARVLGLQRLDEPGRPTALMLGAQKINLHEIGHTFEPKAAVPTPGSGDFCLGTRHRIEDIVARREECGVVAEVGPVQRPGARGPMTSVYFRDPDRNLVEVSRYDD